MNLEGVKTQIYNVVSSYFSANSVFFAEQKMAKPVEPYITIKLNNVKRDTFPIEDMNASGKILSDRRYQADVELNIFSKGKALSGGAYANTTLSDAVDFLDYLDSPLIIDTLETQDITVLLQDGYPKDLSGIINETLYRYRANVVFRIYFHETVGGMYGQSDKTVPNASGGGKTEYVEKADEYFNTATATMIEEDNNE